MTMGLFDKKVADLVARRALVTPSALSEALRRVEAGGCFSSLLIDSGSVAERELIAAIAQEMAIPPIDLDCLSVEAACLGLLPRPMAVYYQVIPVARVGDSLTLAMNNPYDVLTLEALSILTGCTVQPVISVERSIRRNIDRLYRAGVRRGEREGGESPPRSTWSLLVQGGTVPMEDMLAFLLLSTRLQAGDGIQLSPVETGVVRVERLGISEESAWGPVPRAFAERLIEVAGAAFRESIGADGWGRLEAKGSSIRFRLEVGSEGLARPVVLHLAPDEGE
ncbi:MAG: GspE/PulE/PilB domain-containing protein [Planctomycetota bacterium]|jgi:hypothetical protein